jgi:hypothetical protein
MRPINAIAAIFLLLCLTAANTAFAQQNSEEYLPPWQRGGDASEEPGEPERISPPSERSRYEPEERYEEEARPDRYERDERHERRQARPDYDDYDDDSYSLDEIVEAGGLFFGGVTKSLGKVVEYAFQKQGRPNGYILGEEAGGAFIAGLRYGEGTLYTKNIGEHPVYWQGPSLGYDFGADGSKTMILVYNLRYIEQMYNRFAGVDGSAYFVGGAGITFQTYDDMVLAPIRSGVGLRLGANVGYLKYTRTRSWNPF